MLWFLFHKDRLFFYIPAAIFSRMLRKNSQVGIIFIRHGHCSQSELTQQKSVYSRANMLEDTHFYCCRCLRHRMTMPVVSYERPASNNFSACKNDIAGIRKTNALFRVIRTKCNWDKIPGKGRVFDVKHMFIKNNISFNSQP